MKARDCLLQALCARHLRFGETHGGPSRTRCHFTDHDQKMQKFPIAEGEARLNFIEQSPICIFQSNRLAASIAFQFSRCILVFSSLV
jgi:hypothetical protein